MTEEEKKVPEIEVDDSEPEPVEIDPLPYIVVREQGADGPSIRLARAWAFQRIQCAETPLTINTVKYIEMVAQLLANGIVPEDKDSKFKVLK